MPRPPRTSRFDPRLTASSVPKILAIPTSISVHGASYTSASRKPVRGVISSRNDEQSLGAPRNSVSFPWLLQGGMTLSAGARLGPYEIVSLIGVGGMGEVYTARDTRLDRTVAVKVLLKDFLDRTDRRRRFETEARAISSLHHPHICTLFDVGEQDGLAFLVMEYLEGETLDDRLIANVEEIREVSDENGLLLLLSDGSRVMVSRLRRAEVESIVAAQRAKDENRAIRPDL
jgi:serine/threonine protein kinase